MKADVNKQDIDNNSALHLAVQNNSYEAIEALLAFNPNFLLKNKESMTAVDLASSDKILKLFEDFVTKSKAQQPSSRSPKASHLLIAPKRRQSPNPTTTAIGTERKATSKCGVSSISSGSTNSTSSNDKEKVCLETFSVVHQLGKGSFGEVYLVRHNINKKLYAMKILNKKQVYSQNLVKYALTEKNVMSVIRHPFIVSLRYAFQTYDKLFMILDYCPGGDLGKMLRIDKRFTETRARYYLCEVLLAIEYLHKSEIIYRDLKPDNVVLDEEGHALLTDFGLSKDGMEDDDLAQSFCGSVAYLAPEMLARRGHNRTVDWYLLGVLLYEMVVGSPPYYDKNKEKLFQNIQNASLFLPNFLSKEAKSLLSKLLVRNPAKRLGAEKDSEEIKAHPFFAGVNWAMIMKRKAPVPIPAVSKINCDNEIKIGLLFNTKMPSSKDKLENWSFIDREEGVNVYL